MNFKIPVIILKDLVILPNQEIKLELNNAVSNATINTSNSIYGGEVLVVAPMDELEEEPSTADLPRVGVIAKIKNKLDVDDSIQVRLRGIKRVAVLEYSLEKDILFSECMVIDLPSLVLEEENAIQNKLIDVLKSYINSNKNISNAILSYVSNSKDLNKTTDAIASFLPFNISKRLEYMQEINPIYRAKNLISDMLAEIKKIELEEELDENVDSTLEETQKQYYLKEKLKAIQKELGEESWKEIEVKKFNDTLKSLKIDKEIKNIISREIGKFEIMNEVSPEVSVYHNYLDTVLSLPWNKSSKEVNNFDLVVKELDKSHYGLNDVKTRISEYIAVKNLNKNIKSPIICLVGPPGVGKTSIAMAISKAINRKFIKISVGGLNDSTELVGTRRTYLASSPGSIMKGINKVGVNNPLILIDEVDKMVRDYKGDPAATLLEILDPVQNVDFIDNYIEVPFDLSNVMFILTANNTDDIPSTLLDRLEIINLNSYTVYDKVNIAKNYILPRVLQENMVYDNKLKFSDKLIEFIIKKYTKEAGVRDLERVLDSLARKISINNVKVLNEDRIIKLLGRVKYEETLEDINDFGVVNLMAYSALGGKISLVECASFKGDGNITITGNLGEVMKESVNVAMSMLKVKYKYNFNNLDFHFHFLDGSSRKDGPSAGVGIAVSIVSLMEKIKVPSNIAFSGEISLNGNILPVGGLKEKIIGAYNIGIEIIYIPKANINDLEDIPKDIINKLTIIPVSNFDMIYTNIFK